MGDEDVPYVVEASLGTLYVSVSGPEPQFVQEMFEGTWNDRLKEAEEASQALREGTRSCQ